MKTASLPQAIEVLKRFEGLTTKRMAELLSSGLLSDLAELAENDRIPTLDRQELRFFLGIDHQRFLVDDVDYDIPFKDRLAAAREKVYGTKKTHIDNPEMVFEPQTKFSGKRNLPVDLIRFLDPMLLKEVSKKLAAKKLRPLTIEELVAFNVSFPEITNRIIALGTTITFKVNGNTFYPQSRQEFLGGKKLELDIGPCTYQKITWMDWYACTPIA